MNKFLSKKDILCICIILLFFIIFLFATLPSNKSDNTQEDINNISVYNSDYVEVDIDIIHRIKTYIDTEYNDKILIAINIDHDNYKTNVSVLMASEDYIDRVYDYTLNKVQYINESEEEFYEIQDILNWSHIVNEFKYIAKDIKINSNIDSIDNFNLSILDQEDYTTVLFIVDNNGKVIYDSIEKIYRENIG